MGQVLHGCARTTEAVRRAIQNSQESLRTLAARHGVNLKTAVKWKKRDTVSDSPMGPKQPRDCLKNCVNAKKAKANRRSIYDGQRRDNQISQGNG